MRLTSFPVLLVILLIAITARSQQASFNVATIKPYDKAAPGQVMDALIEGLGSDAAPIVFPVTDFSVEVLQDGVAQPAKVRITKFTMIRETNPGTSSRNTVDLAGMKMRSYQTVSFVVPKGLHPGAAQVVVSFKGQRGNSIGLEIIEKPLRPLVGGMSVITVGGIPPNRTSGKIEGNDFGWRLERGTTAKIHVNPLVDPDDPNSAVLVTFKQGGNDYEAVTRITSTAAKVETRTRGVGFLPAREELEVDVPAALTLGKAEVEIRLKVNGLVSDPVKMTATITDITRVAEAPTESAPRVLALTPKRIGAGQSVMVSIDQRRTLEPSPKETQVIIEQDNARYIATIEKNSALIGPSKAPDAPVGLFARTTRQFTGRVQIRVLNPLRGEQTGLSAPVSLEIVDEVLPPEVTTVGESTDAELERLRQMQEMQKEVGKEFRIYDPERRYLTIRAQGIDYNPKFVRITLEQTGQKFTLSPDDFTLFSNDSVIVRLPKELRGGNVNFTIENSGGDRYSTPVTKSFVLQPR